MNWEAWSQVSDAVSFILVTPEFVGEQRLAWFRSLPLTRIWALILHHWRYTVPALIFYAFVTAVAVPAIWADPSAIVSLGARDVLVSIFIIAMTMLLIVATFLQLLAYRGVLFILGALLFLSTRTMSWWYAMHAG